MIRKVLLALAFLGLASPALAQNTLCSDRAAGDSSNACANTRFVQNHPLIIGTTTITGGTDHAVLYNNAGVLGNSTLIQAWSNGLAVGTGASFGVPSDGAFVVNMNSAAVPPYNHADEGLEVFSAQFAAPNNKTNIVVANAYGTAAAGFGVQRSNGTLATPTALLSGDNIANYSSRGYGATAMSRAVANMIVSANENFTDTAQGARFEFQATANGTAGGTQVREMTLYGGSAVFGPNLGVASGTVPAVDINPSAAATLFAGINPVGLRTIAAAGNSSTFAFQNYGFQSIIQAFTASGTAAVPIATASGTTVLNIQGLPWDGVEWGSGGIQTPPVVIQLRTAQLQAPGAHGTDIAFATTPNGSTTRAIALTINNSGGVSIGASATDPAIGNLNLGGGSLLNNGTAPTGTGAYVRATAPTFVTSVTSPLYTAAGALQFGSNGTTVAGTISTGQKWAFGSNAPATGTVPLVDFNTSAAATAYAGTTVPGIRVLGADSVNSTIAFQNYGAQNAVASYLASGTASSPTALASGSILFNFQGLPWDGVEWGSAGNQTPSVALQLKTAQLQAVGAHGTLIDFFTTPNGSTTRATAVRIWGSTGFSIGATAAGTDPGSGGLQMDGQIFLPNITTSSAAQTGTVCWTTGTGKFTADTTVGCLASLLAVKNVTERLSPENALRVVSHLSPFAFRYKDGWGDSGRYEQFGLGAEEVALVDERLVGRDFEGTMKGVRYQELTAVLVGAIQKLEADNDNLRADIKTMKRNN